MRESHSILKIISYILISLNLIACGGAFETDKGKYFNELDNNSSNELSQNDQNIFDPTPPNNDEDEIKASPVQYDEQKVRKSVNIELAELWNHINNRFSEKMSTIFKQAIEESIENIKELSLVEWVQPPKISVNHSPGFQHLSHDLLILRFPEKDNYKLSMKLRIKGEVNKSPIKFKFEDTFHVQISELNFEQSINFNQQDPMHVKVSHIPDPVVNFNVKIIGENDSITSEFISFFGTLGLELVGRYYLHQFIENELKKDFENSIESSHRIIGANGQLFEDNGGLSGFGNLKRLVNNVEEKIISNNYLNHFKHGTLQYLEVDTPAFGSWIDNYTSNDKIDGKITRWRNNNDSPMFNGIYLASQAYRYTVTGDKQAILNIQKILPAVSRLLTINGNGGPLARLVVPKNSPLGQEFVSTGLAHSEKYYNIEVNGQVKSVPFVSYQGEGGVSRDQNIGNFFGLAVVFEQLKNVKEYSHIANQVSYLLRLQVNYLIKNNWVINGDKIVGHEFSDFPTIWTPISLQRYAYLAVAKNAVQYSINKEKEKSSNADEQLLQQLIVDKNIYKQELNQYKNSALALWLPAFFGALDPIKGYYKYNLAYLSFYLIYAFETDSYILSGVDRSFNIYQMATHNHGIATQDLMRIHFNKFNLASKKQIRSAVRESFWQFLQTGHRTVATSQKINFPTVDIRIPGDTTVHTIAEVPLPIGQRRIGSWYQWERGPFSQFSEQNPYIEKVGIDLTFPYWLGRYLSVFSENE